MISEGTGISSDAVNFANVPGIWNTRQVEAWKEIADEVHSKGSFIFLQLWATGRALTPGPAQKSDFEFVSSSAVPMDPAGPVPRELTEEEIHGYIEKFAEAARNAIAAGIDGVEIHGANGYLVDQFTQATPNQRTDKWGGSVENRARFALEVTKAVVAAVGADRVGIKLTPWGKIQGMGTMQDLAPQFEYLISKLGEMRLAYLHLANSRWADESSPGAESNEKYVQLWGDASPVLLEGGYNVASAQEEVDVRYKGRDVGIAFGRFFISNPDLPFRVRMGIDFQKYDRDTFYAPMSTKGYIDYPFSPEWLAAQA